MSSQLTTVNKLNQPAAQSPNRLHKFQHEAGRSFRLFSHILLQARARQTLVQIQKLRGRDIHLRDATCKLSLRNGCLVLLVLLQWLSHYKSFIAKKVRVRAGDTTLANLLTGTSAFDATPMLAPTQPTLQTFQFRVSSTRKGAKLQSMPDKI